MRLTTPLNPIIQKFGVGRLKSPIVQIKEPTSGAIRELLSTPTWSVRSLLPPASSPKSSSSTATSRQQQQTATGQADDSNSAIVQTSDDELTPSKLHHLLRLSALPPPSSPREEASLLKSLRTHLHFVRAIQSVDTTGVEPLVTIRDETDAGIDEATIKLADLQPFLDQEEKVGPNGTVRRRGKIDMGDPQTAREERRKGWQIDVWRLGGGVETRRKGNYFYVKRETRQQENKDNKDSISAKQPNATMETGVKEDGIKEEQE